VNEGTRGAEVETRKLTNAHSYPNSTVMNTDESCKHWWIWKTVWLMVLRL